jgi:hypothetical protein
MAQYPNVHFAVSDGSDIGSGCLDFENALMICQCWVIGEEF